MPPIAAERASAAAGPPSTPPETSTLDAATSSVKSVSIRGKKRTAANVDSPSTTRSAKRSKGPQSKQAGSQTRSTETLEYEVEEHSYAESHIEIVRGKQSSRGQAADDLAEKVRKPTSSGRKKTKSHRKGALKKVESEDGDEDEDEENPSADSEVEEDNNKKVKRKRKTKEEKEAEAMPLATRSSGLRMFVGAHVSAAKGVHNSITNTVHIGGNAFALFLKSQRKWDNPPLQDEVRDQFRNLCGEHKYNAASHVLPHGSYLVNLAQEEPTKAKQAYDSFMDDLRRCEALGIKLYNFHPGASGSSDIPSAVSRLANQLNRALTATSTVMPVLENMAGSGTVLGSTFASLASIIALIAPEHKSRIGVCLDTCHSFAAGYDLRTPASFKKVLDEFDKVVGMQYLEALHLNDSKTPLGSKRDLHQNIGLGFLGLRAFHNVMNEPRFENLPLILETPCDRPDPNDKTGKKTIEDKSVWAREIKLLESLIGMDAEGKEFKALEMELADKGKSERAKYQDVFDKKVLKERKKTEKGQTTLKGFGSGKRKKGVRSEDEDGDEE